MHEQALVKVNALIDKDIAPLVEILNRFKNILTLDSCQDGAEGAYVYFSWTNGSTYQTNWKDLGAFLDQLSVRLRDLGLCCGYSLRLEWFGNNEQPRAQLVISPRHVAAVTERIREMVLSGPESGR